MRNVPVSTAATLTVLAALITAGCGPAEAPPPVAPATTTAPPALAAAALGDGGRIAAALRAGGGADILTMNPDGSDPKQLTDDPSFDACPSFGPGGSLIAFCSNRSGAFEIWLMDAAGGQERPLTALEGNATFSDISPAGQRVVFCGSPKGAAEGDHDIWVVNVDGTGLAQLTKTPGEDDCNPAWSPDGSKVLFTSNRGGSPEVWVMDAAGQGAKQVTTGQGAGLEPPDWSPDGSSIAFIAQDAVWVSGVDGSAPRRLTQAPGTDQAPAWSPKGNEIVYRHLDGETGSLRIVSVGSGQSRAVPISAGNPLAPDWQS